MKSTALTAALLLLGLCLQAQSTSVEQEIRQLEEKERQATLERDTAALHKLWSAGFVVNAPTGRVVLPGKNTVDRPVITQLKYASFTRQVEHIVEKEGVVFAMGSEVIVPVGAVPNAGKPVQRRYTNIWMKEGGTWKLVARHASEICRP